MNSEISSTHNGTNKLRIRLEPTNGIEMEAVKEMLEAASKGKTIKISAGTGTPEKPQLEMELER